MSSDRSRARAGFTVVELLVALVLAAILSTIVFQLLRGQSRFTALQSAREEVQQNVRGALDVMSSELRGVHPAAGLLNGQINRVRFLVPRFWGLACATTTTTAATVIFPQLPAGSLATGNLGGSWGMAGITSALGATPVVWATSNSAFGTTSSITTATAAGAAACAALQPAGNVTVLQLAGTGFPAVAPGNRVYLYQVVEYDAGIGTDGLTWVRRAVAGGTPQPMAGPLPAADSLRFRYFSDAGAVAAPGTTQANLAAVDRVQIHLTTKSRSRASGTYQTQRDSVTVYLRNQ